MPLRTIEYRQLLQIVTMFMIVQFAGLLLATQVYTGATYEQITGAQIASSSMSALFYIAYIAVFSVLLLFIFKIYKGDKLFVLLEGVVVLASSFVVFYIGISALLGNVATNLFGNGGTFVSIVAVAMAVALVVAKNRKPGLRNLTAVISSVGVGLILGVSFSFTTALIFMFLLAAYDFIAVFITKHMIALGNLAINKNLSFLVMVNEVKAVPLKSLAPSERKEYLKEKGAIAKRGGMLRALVKSDMVPMAARTALGTGDLAMPLMLAVSAYKAQLSFVLSFVIVLGAVLGLFITMLILRKYRRALPAIPPLLFGILIALGLYYLPMLL